MPIDTEALRAKAREIDEAEKAAWEVADRPPSRAAGLQVRGVRRARSPRRSYRRRRGAGALT